MRRLTAHERALWSRVAATVRPLPGKRRPAPPEPVPAAKSATPAPRAVSAPKPATAPRPAPPVAVATLDGSWDRKLRKGDIVPDRVIDLHGHNLADAHAALSDIIESDSGERVLLVITGKGRADRPSRIRSELNYWLESSRLRSRIAAMRPAHPRHGGSGAFYVILRRKP
jgi:DNA-nicking Smr family endonuclease